MTTETTTETTIPTAAETTGAEAGVATGVAPHPAIASTTPGAAGRPAAARVPVERIDPWRVRIARRGGMRTDGLIFADEHIPEVLRV